MSPTALSKMGENAFKLAPVGAGPFTVVSDTVSSELALKKNPRYWSPGEPYLNTLTFKSVASDETALETMQAGGVQGYEGMQTPQLVSAFSQQFNVLDVPSTSPYVIQLNTGVAPFNNLHAREAVYYATDVPVIDQKLFGNLHPVTEGFTAPNGLFYQQDVPGYRTYDLAKAKAAVKAAGGRDRRPDGHPELGHPDRARGAADDVAGGRHEGDDPRRPAALGHPAVPEQDLAGVAADGGGVRPGRRVSG